MHTYISHSRTPSLFTGTISFSHHYPSYHPPQLNEENNKKLDLCTFELQTTATKTHNTHSILADQSSGMFTTDRPCSLVAVIVTTVRTRGGRRRRNIIKLSKRSLIAKCRPSRCGVAPSSETPSSTGRRSFSSPDSDQL